MDSQNNAFPFVFKTWIYMNYKFHKWTSELDFRFNIYITIGLGTFAIYNFSKIYYWAHYRIPSELSLNVVIDLFQTTQQLKYTSRPQFSYLLVNNHVDLLVVFNELIQITYQIVHVKYNFHGIHIISINTNVSCSVY